MKLLPIMLILCLWFSGCGTQRPEDTTPSDSIHAACLRGDMPAVRRFCDTDPKAVNVPDTTGETPLQAAAFAKQTAIAEFLIRRGAETDAGDFLGYTPLHKCAEVDNREGAILLLRNGVKPDIVARQWASQRFGITPLELAAMRGHVEFAKLLLDSGASPSTILPDDSTALHWACGGRTAACYQGIKREQRVRELIRLLIKSGARVDQVDRGGATPLHKAVSCGDVGAVQTLLKEGANVNAKDGLGDTPLHRLASGLWVTSNGPDELRIARILLENSADKGVRNAHDETPGDVARRLRRKEIVAVLISGG